MMKIFGQTAGEFFRSKSNLTGVLAITSSISAFVAGQVDVNMMMQGIFAGCALIFVKDAIVKTDINR